MQLLYGNDGTNYCTIAKSADMTEAQEKELLAGYLGYDFVKDQAAYSSVEKEPAALVYSTTNLSNTLPQEMVLLAFKGRMSNYATPSYWAHFQLMNPEEACYGKRFLEYLRFSFVRDVDIKEYLHRNIDEFQGNPDSVCDINTDAVDREKLLVLVAAILSVADSMSRQVRLILDVEGDLYNERALEVIASVYKYLPYNIRKVAGFSTYAGGEGRISNRVKLQIYPRDARGSLGHDAIDLKEMEIQRELARIPAAVVTFAKDLIQQTKETREGWFESFQSVFHLETVTLKDHLGFYYNVQKWKREKLDDLLDEIAAYALKEVNSDKPSAVFLIFCSIFAKRFQEEQYYDRYQMKTASVLNGEESFRFSKQLMAYLALGEVLEGVEHDAAAFQAWEDRAIIHTLEAKYDEAELIAQYKKQYEQLMVLKCGNRKFEKIKLQMGEKIKERVEEARRRIQERTEEEKENLKQFFVTASISCQNLEELWRVKNSIRYKENIEIFSALLFENLVSALRKLPYFKSFHDDCEYHKMLGKMQTSLSREQSNILWETAEEKGQVVRAMEKWKTLVWTQREDLLRCYENIANMNALSGQRDVVIPQYVLKMGGQTFSLSEKELKALLTFLLCPSGEAANESREIMMTQTGMIEALLEIQAFLGEHFSFLMQWEIGSEVKELVIRYYLEENLLLSRSQAEKGLTGIQLERLAEKMPQQTDVNMIGLVVKEKTTKVKRGIWKQILRKKR